MRPDIYVVMEQDQTGHLVFSICLTMEGAIKSLKNIYPDIEIDGENWKSSSGECGYIMNRILRE